MDPELAGLLRLHNQLLLLCRNVPARAEAPEVQDALAYARNSLRAILSKYGALLPAEARREMIRALARADTFAGGKPLHLAFKAPKAQSG